MSLVRVEGLTKHFPVRIGFAGRARVHAVDGVAFFIREGETLGLVGESGSGKSTVARMLAGQQRPTSGTIWLDGEQADLSSRRAFRRYKGSVQMVFQDPFA
ncbi:MAG TPA: ATP-binding cassette domain-containing protein, partial [Thermoplasmata archaeon]|nr:ATP-binding cassette domain-containing protein [Thermoplasmata archaeon]